MPPPNLKGYGSSVLVALLSMAIAAVSFVAFEPATAVASCILGWPMLAIAVTDARRFIIPDILSLPSIPAGLIAARWLSYDQAPHEALLEHLGAAAGGALALYGINAAYRLWRGRDGLGLGDVKLAAVAGAWTGLFGLALVLLLACVLAFAFVLVTHARNLRAIHGAIVVPFGVFLAPAIWLVWCFELLNLSAAVGFHI